MKIINEGAGTSWDPHLIRVFGDHLSEFDRIRVRHRPRTPVQRPVPVDGAAVIGSAAIGVSVATIGG